jgi:hypothetical protein
MPRERIADDKELSATEAAPPATNPPAGKPG